MFKNDAEKLQGDSIPTPEGLPPEVIVSPDAGRMERLPPHQKRTKKWPVLDSSGPPQIDLARWRFSISGLVARPVEWTWEQFLELPRTKVYADFHCVTRWSRLGNLWEGVATRELVRQAGGLRGEPRYAIVSAYDAGFTTNLPVEHFLAADSLVAVLHDGAPLTVEHGGPARLIVPRLYAWKSAKWVAGVELVERDQPGYWERGGYHRRGDPWLEERYGW